MKSLKQFLNVSKDRIDEISKDLAHRYWRKAYDNYVSTGGKPKTRDWRTQERYSTDRDFRRHRDEKRREGLRRASDRISENQSRIDEISRDLAKRYTKRASDELHDYRGPKRGESPSDQESREERRNRGVGLARAKMSKDGREPYVKNGARAKVRVSEAMSDEERKRYHDFIGVGHHVWNVNYSHGKHHNRNVRVQTSEKSEAAVRGHRAFKNKRGLRIHSIEYKGVREAPTNEERLVEASEKHHFQRAERLRQRLAKRPSARLERYMRQHLKRVRELRASRGN